MRFNKSSLVRKHRGSTHNSKCNESSIITRMTRLAELMMKDYREDRYNKTIRTISFEYVVNFIGNKERAKDFIAYINPNWEEKDGDEITYYVDTDRNCLVLTPTISAIRTRFDIIVGMRNNDEKFNRITKHLIKVKLGKGRKAFGIIFFYLYLKMFIPIPGASGEYSHVFK